MFAVLAVYVQPFFIIVWFLVSHNLLFISEYCFVLKVCGHHHWALWAAAWSPRWGRWSGASWRRWWPPAAACSSWGWGRPAPRWPTCWCPAGVKCEKLFIVDLRSSAPGHSARTPLRPSWWCSPSSPPPRGSGRQGGSSWGRRPGLELSTKVRQVFSFQRDPFRTVSQ